MPKPLLWRAGMSAGAFLVGVATYNAINGVFGIPVAVVTLLAFAALVMFAYRLEQGPEEV